MCSSSGDGNNVKSIGTRGATTHSLLSSPNTRPKPVVVVRKRKIKRQRGAGLAAPVRRGGLPSLRPDMLSSAIVAQEEKHQRDQQQQDNDMFALDATQEAVFQSLPSDTLLVIQTLQSNPQTCLSIPLLNGRTVRAVLECQIHRRLALDQTASLEVHDAMGKELVRLNAASPPSQQQDSLQVLVTVAEFEQGVWDALERRKQTRIDDNEKEHSFGVAAQWLILRLQNLSKSRIAQSDLRDIYDQDPPVLAPVGAKQRQLPLTQLLDNLQQLQLILPSHHYNSYQLWLPEWGTVLKAWEESRKKLLAKIKRSYHKERSMAALQAPHSPIPTPVLVEWLLSQGLVEEIQRPSGNFLRIVQ